MTVGRQEIIVNEPKSLRPGFSSVFDMLLDFQSRCRIATGDTVPIDTQSEAGSNELEDASPLEDEYDESVVSSVSSNSHRRYQVNYIENDVDMTNAVPPLEIEIRRITSFVPKKFPAYDSEFKTASPQPITTTILDFPNLQRPQAPNHASADDMYHQMSVITPPANNVEFSALGGTFKTVSTYSISDRDMEWLGSRPRYHMKPPTSFSVVDVMADQSTIIRRSDTGGYPSLNVPDENNVVPLHRSITRSEPRGLQKCRQSLQRIRRNSTGAIRKKVKSVVNRVTAKPIQRFRKVEEAPAELQRAQGCFV